MHIAICDDIKSDCELIKKYTELYCNSHSLSSELSIFENGEALLDSFHKKPYDIVFLDIYMCGKNGIETARVIRNAGFKCMIIFTTSSPDHALESFEVEAVHYLVKPIGYEQVEKALDRCKHLFAISDKYIEVVSNRIPVRVPLKYIIFAEVFSNVTILHTVSGEIKTYMTLDELTHILIDEEFLRCHRSFIVNMDFIAGMENSNFIMKSNHRIPIRRQDKQQMKQCYANYLFNTIRGRHVVQ